MTWLDCAVMLFIVSVFLYICWQANRWFDVAEKKEQSKMLNYMCFNCRYQGVSKVKCLKCVKYSEWLAK